MFSGRTLDSIRISESGHIGYMSRAFPITSEKVPDFRQWDGRSMERSWRRLFYLAANRDHGGGAIRDERLKAGWQNFFPT